MKLDPAYFSHIGMLVDIILKTKGDVLELGIGWGSTPVLHELCRDRYLISLENDYEVFKSFIKFDTYWHRVDYVKNWDNVTYDKPYSVAFIDNKPARRRRTDIKLLKPYADFIVIHDTEPQTDKYFRVESRIKTFKYIKKSGIIPETTIVSDKYPIP